MTENLVIEMGYHVFYKILYKNILKMNFYGLATLSLFHDVFRRAL